MNQLILLLFFGWSLTSIIVNGSIFDELRNFLIVRYPFLGKLFSCVMCLSVWVGLLLFTPLLLFGYVDPFKQIPFWFNFILLPILQSGFSVACESVVIFLVKGAKSK